MSIWGWNNPSAPPPRRAPKSSGGGGKKGGGGKLCIQIAPFAAISALLALVNAVAQSLMG